MNTYWLCAVTTSGRLPETTSLQPALPAGLIVTCRAMPCMMPPLTNVFMPLLTNLMDTRLTRPLCKRGGEMAEYRLPSERERMLYSIETCRSQYGQCYLDQEYQSLAPRSHCLSWEHQQSLAYRNYASWLGGRGDITIVSFFMNSNPRRNIEILFRFGVEIANKAVLNVYFQVLTCGWLQPHYRVLKT